MKWLLQGVLTVPAIMLFLCWLEWFTHRHLMHRRELPGWAYRRLPQLSKIFESHHVIHHGDCFRTFDHDDRHICRLFNIEPDFGLTLILLAPLFALLTALAPGVSIALLASVVVHHVFWGIMHGAMHNPLEYPTLRRHGWWRVLARHHFLHHINPSRNYNVTLPIFDHAFNTRARATRADLREIVRLGLGRRSGAGLPPPCL